MGDVTEILLNWSNESKESRDQVVAAMYAELRRNAAGYLRGERDIELQPTALVNEAYLRLVRADRIDLDGRSHFLGIAGRIMREILVDQARRLRTQKRDHARNTRFTGDQPGADLPAADLLHIDRLLQRLEEIDPVYVQLFEYRAFAGMTIEESASLLALSPATVKRKWQSALAWIKEEMAANDQPET